MGVVSAMMQVGAAIKHAVLFTVDYSLRFDGSGDYLSFTPSSTSTSNKFTLSMWLRRDKLAALQYLFAATPNTITEQAFRLNSNNRLFFYYWDGTGTPWDVETTETIADYEWHHVVLAVDTAQSGADKVKIWIDDTPATHASATYPSGALWFANSSYQHDIGSWRNTYNFSGQLAEVHFIDGTALDPSYFGETRNGQWVPKEVTGVTYGNNGFHLDFADSSTASALGTDVSGKNNDFTVPANTLTPDDQLIDTPNLRFATLNPSDAASGAALSNANLTSAEKSTNTPVRATDAKSSGKWYFEFRATSGTMNDHVGAWDTAESLGTSYVGQTAGSWSMYLGDSRVRNNGSSDTSYASGAWTPGQVGMIAMDLANGELYFGRDGTWFSSGDPATRTNPAFTNLTGTLAAAATGRDTTTFNFGQDHTFAGAKSPLTSPYTDADGNGEYYYQPPAGFKALATSY